MLCKCGGETVNRVAVNNRVAMTLSFVECRACGRCGQFLLQDKTGIAIAAGAEAQHQFEQADVKGRRAKVEYIGDGQWVECNSREPVELDDFLWAVPGKSPAFTLLKY